MFDRYDIQSGPSHVTVTKTVHEHRAPTDESVKLLSEMEEKSIARIVHGELVEASSIEVFYLAIRPRFEDGDYEFRYVFRLNGKDIDGRVVIRHHEWERLADNIGIVHDESCAPESRSGLLFQCGLVYWIETTWHGNRLECGCQAEFRQDILDAWNDRIT